MISGRPVIRYDLTRQDLEKFRVGLARLDQLFRAAGAARCCYRCRRAPGPSTLAGAI